MIGLMVPSVSGLTIENPEDSRYFKSEYENIIQNHPLIEYLPIGMINDTPSVNDVKFFAFRNASPLPEYGACELFLYDETYSCVSKLDVVYKIRDMYPLMVKIIEFESSKESVSILDNLLSGLQKGDVVSPNGGASSMIEAQKEKLKKFLDNPISEQCFETQESLHYNFHCYKENYFFIMTVHDFKPDVASHYGDALFKKLSEAESATESIKEQKVEAKQVLSFVDQSKDPAHYVKRYVNEPEYQKWFNEHFPDYKIWEGIGITQQEYQNIVNDLNKVGHESKTEPVKELPKITSDNPQKDSELYYHKGYAFLVNGYGIQAFENLEKALALATPGTAHYDQVKLIYDSNKDYREGTISGGGGAYFVVRGMVTSEIRDGFIHLFDQEPEKALPKCSNVLKNDSENIYAWICTQSALIKLDKYDQVTKNYENYLHLSSQHYPQDQVTIFGKPNPTAPANVIAYYHLGEYDGAIFDLDSRLNSDKKYNQRPAEKIRDMSLALQYLLPKAAILEKMGQTASANSIYSSIANSPHAKTSWMMFHEEWNYEMIRGMAYASVLDYSKAVEYYEKAPYVNSYASQQKVIVQYENDKRNPVKAIESMTSVFESESLSMPDDILGGLPTIGSDSNLLPLENDYSEINEIINDNDSLKWMSENQGTSELGVVAVSIMGAMIGTVAAAIVIPIRIKLKRQKMNSNLPLSLPGKILFVVGGIMVVGGMMIFPFPYGILSWIPIVIAGVVIIMVDDKKKSLPRQSTVQEESTPVQIVKQESVTQTLSLTCRKCNSPILENAKFCSNCGSSTVPKPSTRRGLVCANCKNPLKSGEKFCGKCGCPYVPKTNDRMGLVCTNCYNSLKASEKFCGKCGNPV